MHGDVCLPAIGMAKNDMRARLSAHNETGPLQTRENFTRFVRHLRSIREWKKRIRPGRKWVLRWRAFRRSKRRADRKPPGERHRFPDHAWSVQGTGYARTSDSAGSQDQ